MKLFLVHDSTGWGYSFNIVRASSVEELRMVCPPRSKSDFERMPEKYEVTEIPLQEGPPMVLWSFDESPDTGES